MNNDDPFAAVLDQPVSIDVGDDPFAAVVNQKSTIADDPFREVVRPKDTKEKLKAEQAKIAAEGDTGFAGGFGAEIGERLGEFGKGVAGIVPAAMKAVAALQHSMDQGYEEGDIPPEARPTFKAATAVEKFEEKILPSPTNPDIWHGVAQGGGQVAQMLAGGAAAKAAGAGMAGMTALASTMGGIQEFGDAYEMSRNRGDDPDTALAKSLGYATVAGLIENKLGAGRLLRRYFPTAKEAVQKLTALGVSKTLLGNFIAGGLEEGSQRWAENLIVEGRPSMEGVLEEAGPGAIVEGIAGIPHVATTLRESGAPLTAAAVEQINLPILTAEQTGEIAPQLVAVSKADAAADNFAAAGTEQGILEAVEPDIGFDIRKMVKSNRAVELLTEAESTAGLNEILPTDERTDIRKQPVEIGGSDAIQKQSANAEVLGNEVQGAEPQLGLRPLGEGNQESQAAAGTSQETLIKKGGDQVETQKEKGRQENVLAPTAGETKAERFQIGQGPQTFTLIEKLPQTEIEKTNGEQPVRVKNERTGKEEIVLESELRQVKESTGEKPKRTTKADLNVALKNAGLDPSAFPDQKSKKSALERAAAKVEEAQKKLRGSRATVSMGVPKAILDLALESIRLALRAGATVQAAIEKGIAAAMEKFSETNEDDLRAAIVESIASERKESQGFLTGQYASNPELRQAQEAEAFAQGKTDDQILSEVQGFSGGQSIPGLSDMNVPLVVANLTTSLFDKLTKTTDPVEVADLNAKIAKAASLLQQRDSVAGQGLQAVKLAKARIGFMAPYLAFRGLAQKMWARALGVPETTDIEGETVKVVKDSAKKAAGEVTENDVEKQIKSEAVAKALLKAIRESGIKLSTLFLDNDHASQAERRKHLFEQIRKQFPDLTQEQKLSLEKALSEAWENARLKIWRGQFKKIVGLPEVATENILDAVQPELIRQANLGTLTDEAFRSAIARKLGLPDIDGNTAQEMIKLSQEAQAAPEGLLRNKILQKMIDKIQSSGDFSSWDLLRDYWYASTLSGLRTATAVLLGSWLTGAAMTTGMAFDLAITKASPAVASKLIAAYVMDTIEGFANGYDVFKTGDYTRRAEFADNINAVLSGKGKLDSLEGFLRHGNAKWKKALGVQAYVRRAIVGLDYVGAIATRGSGIIYNAALKGGDQLEIANRRFNKKLSQQAKTQAKVELGPGSKWVDVKARQLEILEEGLSHEIQQQAKVLGELAALNAQPVGWSGIAYGALEGLAQVIGKKAGVSRESASFGAFAFRTAVGLAFFRAALNQVGNASNWVPGIGGVQWFRSYLGTKTPEWSKNNPLRHLAILDENGQPITEDRRRLILAAQAMSISASIALYALAHAAADDDDKDGFDVSGSWRGYTPQEKKRKQEAGEIPYGFTLHKKTGRWYSWKDMGFGGAFVIPGELRDKERRTGKPTEFDDASKAFSTMTDAAAMGSLYVKDLSMLSGLFQALGVSAFNTEEAATGANRMAAQLTRPVSGMIPFSSLLREIDTWGDNQVYRPSSGADYWIMAIPFVRRYVGEGPEYNMAGLPVRKTLTPASRFVAEEANDPLVKALASLVNRGIMPHFPYNAGWIKDGERKSSKDFAERDYQYKVQAVKAWREIMLPDAAEISKMTDKEYQEYYQKNLAPIAQEIHDDFQNEIDPDVLRRRRGAKHGQRKYEKNPRYEMKGKE